ncbi:hypothetical protein CERSUDRAFT_100866 [Gelatoporia subvermispora B]|uniref:Uncharacterized protein n=1 Tax=Ceriporiopsis subvermispora (strain B) TaxID=914234 RepID=M2QWS9_CERS8|nr:hypothetical protein CERSUDRAFT_100866 [Gelatoporia subvermispora B]
MLPNSPEQNTATGDLPQSLRQLTGDCQARLDSGDLLRPGESLPLAHSVQEPVDNSSQFRLSAPFSPQLNLSFPSHARASKFPGMAHDGESNLTHLRRPNLEPREDCSLMEEGVTDKNVSPLALVGNPQFVTKTKYKSVIWIRFQ